MAVIEVHSVEAVETLGAALVSFRRCLDRSLNCIESAAFSNLRRLENKCAGLERAAQKVENQLDRLRDRQPHSEAAQRRHADRVSKVEDKLYELHSEFNVLDSERMQLEAAYGEYRRHVAALHSLLEFGGIVQCGADYLKHLAKALRAFTEIDWASVGREITHYQRSASPSPCSAPPRSPRMAPSQISSINHHSYAALSEIPLPEGYRWVRLNEIDLSEAVASFNKLGDRPKASFDELAEGFEMLRTEILPRLKVGNCSRETLAAIDQQRGAVRNDGLAHCYDAFFEHHECIKLAQGVRSDKLSIDNGKHRVRVALDKGWDAVIAQVNDSTHNLP